MACMRSNENATLKKMQMFVSKKKKTWVYDFKARLGFVLCFLVSQGLDWDHRHC